MFIFNLTSRQSTNTLRAELFSDTRQSAMQVLTNWQAPIQWLLTSDAPNAIDRIKEFYQYFGTSCLMTGGEILSNGDYEYPQDPILKPYAKLTLDTNEHVYLYPYDILGVVAPNGEQKVMRVD